MGFFGAAELPEHGIFLSVSQKKSEEAPDFNQGRNRMEKRRRHSKN